MTEHTRPGSIRAAAEALLHGGVQPPPASQVLVEAASALQRVLDPDGPSWGELPDKDKDMWGAYASPTVLAVLMLTKPPGWQALFDEITAMATTWARANTGKD